MVAVEGHYSPGVHTLPPMHNAEVIRSDAASGKPQERHPPPLGGVGILRSKGVPILKATNSAIRESLRAPDGP